MRSWKQILLDEFQNNEDVYDQFWYLADAHPGEFGWNPFIIQHAIENESNDEDDVFLFCLSFDPEAYQEGIPVNEYLWLRATFQQLYLHESYFAEPEERYLEDLYDFEGISWKNDIGPARLRRLTASQYHRRYTCPECNNDKEIDAGATGVAERWPIFRYKRSPAWLGCPRCELFYMYCA